MHRNKWIPLFLSATTLANQNKGIFSTSIFGTLCPSHFSLYQYIFIGPKSDHWLCLSLTNSLTHSLTHFIDVTCHPAPGCANFGRDVFWNAPASYAFPDYESFCIFMSTERKEILVLLTPFLFLQMFQTQCLILPSAPPWEKSENLLFGDSSYASSIFSDMETIFHTQDKPLLLLALFPLCCVLSVCLFRLCLNLVS